MRRILSGLQAASIRYHKRDSEEPRKLAATSDKVAAIKSFC